MEDKEDSVTKDLERATPVKAEIVPKPSHLPNGNFAKGNKLAHGNPWVAQMQAFQRCFLDSVKKAELRAVIKAMIKKAKEGDVNAARLIVERICGKMPQDAGIQVTNLSQGNLTICIQTDNENSLENGPSILEEPPPPV
jgi:hypothetical protein